MFVLVEIYMGQFRNQQLLQPDAQLDVLPAALVLDCLPIFLNSKVDQFKYLASTI